MNFFRRAWRAWLDSQRPRPVHPRMKREEVDALVRVALVDRGGVYPEEQIYATPYAHERGVCCGRFFVRMPEAVFGAHVHLHVDDATGQVVKRFDAPH